MFEFGYGFWHVGGVGLISAYSWWESKWKTSESVWLKGCSGASKNLLAPTHVLTIKTGSKTGEIKRNGSGVQKWIIVLMVLEMLYLRNNLKNNYDWNEVVTRAFYIRLRSLKSEDTWWEIEFYCFIQVNRAVLSQIKNSMSSGIIYCMELEWNW